jgi:hypothetical protein
MNFHDLTLDKRSALERLEKECFIFTERWAPILDRARACASLLSPISFLLHFIRFERTVILYEKKERISFRFFLKV